MSNAILNQAWLIHLKPTDKSVLVALADCAGGDGTTYVAVRSRAGKRDLLTMTGLSERAIQGAIKRLHAAGHITQDPRAGTSSTYAVHPGARPAADAGVQEVRPAADARTPAAGAETPAAHAPKPLLSIINPPSGRTAKQRGELPTDWQPPQLSEEAGRLVAAWPAGRAEIEREKFVAHHAAKGSKFVDWNAAWRTWVLNASRWERSSPARQSTIGWDPVSRKRAAHA